MLVRQNSPSARTSPIRQSNDFTDLGTLEANLWFIGVGDLRVAPIGAGTRLAMQKGQKACLTGKSQIEPDRRNSISRSSRREFR
jgi:hypothetical protein